MIISQKIFSLLEQRGMSQKEFSARAEISPSTISDWKRKKTNPSADKIIKICEVLQVTPYELLTDGANQNMISPQGDFLIISRDESVLIESFRRLDTKRRSGFLGMRRHCQVRTTDFEKNILCMSRLRLAYIFICCIIRICEP